MANAVESVASGLEGVAVAETCLSWVDGVGGRLLIDGEDVERLAGVHRFEEVAGSLWAAGSEPPSGAVVKSALGAARARAFSRLREIARVFYLPNAMDALRAAIAGETERPRVPGEPPWLAAADLTGA